jgi:hypothetical protein
VLALVLLAAFNAPGLALLRDTPVPLLLGLAALMFPLAFVMHLVLHAHRPAEALHLASLAGTADAARGSRARALAYELQGRKGFWVLCLMFAWGYMELTASSILAPLGMTPVVKRLHELMHFGHSSVLSAMLVAAFALPAALLAAALALRRASVAVLAGSR